MSRLLPNHDIDTDRAKTQKFEDVFSVIQKKMTPLDVTY
jgi:hypothetical protein